MSSADRPLLENPKKRSSRECCQTSCEGENIAQEGLRKRLVPYLRDALSSTAKPGRCAYVVEHESIRRGTVFRTTPEISTHEKITNSASIRCCCRRDGERLPSLVRRYRQNNLPHPLEVRAFAAVDFRQQSRIYRTGTEDSTDRIFKKSRGGIHAADCWSSGGSGLRGP